MATPESIIEAFASGLMKGLLKAEKPTKADKPNVVPVDSVRKAVFEYLDAVQQSEEPKPQQQELFPEPGFIEEPTDEMSEMILRKVEEARARAEASNTEPPEGWIEPDMPGSASGWMGPQGS